MQLNGTQVNLKQKMRLVKASGADEPKIDEFK